MKKIVSKKFILEEGCLSFGVAQNSENPFKFDVYEEFKDKVSFEHHQERVKASKWGKITQNATRYYNIFK
ncbi:MAG: antibiotic biosynthesis monooxygenase [Proteobacteria bacterium]|nr:MAG: antibiotic biosynthesis monooxygenase [Pseudomonadota bacterium]